MSPQGSHFRAYLWLLVIFAAVIVIAYAFDWSSPPTTQPTPAATATNIPAPTPTDYVNAQQPFDYLVSYTVSGFHPVSLSMSVGQTVRFTDNDPEGSLSIQGAATSPVLQQGEYWQYTATKAGSVTFSAGVSSMKLTVTQ